MSGPLNSKALRLLVKNYLKEDIGSGDVTTDSVVPSGLKTTGVFIAKQSCVLCGLEFCREAFRILDPSVRWVSDYRDGAQVRKGCGFARVTGRARSLLTAERVALNLLQRLSGVATLTREFVSAVRGTSAKILDTRKTTPGWRLLEKYAVQCGGGLNHRLGLFDAILIKDNHIVLAGGVREAIQRARQFHMRKSHGHRVLPLEVEVASQHELIQALDELPDRILLDNMSPREVKLCIDRIREFPTGPKIIVECSGGMTLRTVRAYAQAGADWISVGALTHSAPAVDISFEMDLG